jgi:alpha-beta hydrolase superfamily lysophospholipase
MRWNHVIAVLFCGFLESCSYFRDASEKPNTTAFDPAQVRREMVPLNLKTPYHPTKEIEAYFQFYQLDDPDVEHYFGTIVSENSALAAHVFIPTNPRGTLFLIHGYFDHTGTFSKLIAAGLAHHYAVVSWDLPGHGISSGDRTDTGSFDRCARQFVDIVQRSETELPKPFHLISHSTGCSIAIEYIHNSSTNAFDQVVFLAPLIRHAHWGFGKFGYFIANPFSNKIRRRDKKNTSDTEYLAFVKQDPLHSGILSFEYLEDLYAWEKQVQNDSVWPGSVLIIQGDRDTVVDWKYNLEFLRKKIKHPEVHLISGARHQLTNESDAFRNQVFDIIFQQLDTRK